MIVIGACVLCEERKRERERERDARTYVCACVLFFLSGPSSLYIYMYVCTTTPVRHERLRKRAFLCVAVTNILIFHTARPCITKYARMWLWSDSVHGFFHPPHRTLLLSLPLSSHWKKQTKNPCISLSPSRARARVCVHTHTTMWCPQLWGCS